MRHSGALSVIASGCETGFIHSIHSLLHKWAEKSPKCLMCGGASRYPKMLWIKMWAKLAHPAQSRANTAYPRFA
jgi:hypothetical protein